MSAMKVSAEERRKMIAEAAYFRAAKRGFDGGDATADWIEAEAEVNERLRQMEHDASVERLEERFAAAREHLRSLRRKIARRKAEVRTEFHKDLEKLVQLQGTLGLQLQELRERGRHAGRSVRQQAEEVANEISEKISQVTARLGTRRRAASRDAAGHDDGGRTDSRREN
jgi:phosphoenolpyruvate-protein kinase (PTS system EI component)